MKIIKNKFTSSGIGSTSITIGFVDLISSNQIISAGSTNNLLYREAGKTESLFVNAEILNGTTNERTYAEIFIDHDELIPLHQSFTLIMMQMIQYLIDLLVHLLQV